MVKEGIIFGYKFEIEGITIDDFLVKKKTKCAIKVENFKIYKIISMKTVVIN